MPGNVKFVLDADSAKAVSGFLKIVDAQKKVEGGAKSVGKASEESENAMQGLGKSMTESVVGPLEQIGASLISFETLKEYVAEVGEHFERMGEAGIHLEHSITPLIALGANAQHIGRTKEELVGMATAYEQTNDSMGEAMGLVERSMRDQPHDQQKMMLADVHELTEVIGGSYTQNLGDAIKLWQAYGSQVGDAGAVTDKMLKLYQQGVDTSQMGEITKAMLQAKQAGLSADEYLSLVSTTLQFGGSDPRMLRSMGQVFAQLPALLKETGATLSGSVGDKLSEIVQLANANPDIIAKMFPKGEATWVQEMGQHLDTLQSRIEEFAAMSGGEVGHALGQRMADPVFRGTSAIEMAKTADANIDALRAQNPNYLRLNEAYHLTKLGHDYTAGPWEPDALKTMAINDEMLVRPYASADLRAGLNLMIDQIMATAGGAKSKEEYNRLTAQAEGLKISFGEAEKLGVNSGDHFTAFDDADAQKFYALRNQGYDINSGVYQQYRQLQTNGAGDAADAYLGRYRTQTGGGTGLGGGAIGNIAQIFSGGFSPAMRDLNNAARANFDGANAMKSAAKALEAAANKGHKINSHTG